MSVKCELYSEMIVSETLLYSVYGEDILEYGCVGSKSVFPRVFTVNLSCFSFALCDFEQQSFFRCNKHIMHYTNHFKFISLNPALF